MKINENMKASDSCKIQVTPQVIAIFYLEVVSKPQIRFKGKAQADRESAAYMGM